MIARPRPTPLVLFRSGVYAVWLVGLLVLMGIVCLPALLGPRSWVLAVLRGWCGAQYFGLRWIVGIRIEFRGLEHAPKDSALVAAKHLSELDAIAPFAVLPDPCFVLKQELMRLPILGWYTHAAKMIPIHRGGGSNTVKAMSEAAAERLKEPRQLVIFPEGTRKLPGAPPAYKGGTAALYRDLKLPCTPVATNSGLFWPQKGMVFRPGVAVFEFLEPIPPGLHRAEFMRELEGRIETATRALLAEAAR
jgi:1-acyl-sn-glycerol-3-phosphate acyltransferase